MSMHLRVQGFLIHNQELFLQTELPPQHSHAYKGVGFFNPQAGTIFTN